MSDAETLLAVQLDQAGIPYEREFRFAPPRRWRADFSIQGMPSWHYVEVPVAAGEATLPDGSTIRVSPGAKVVRIPVLDKIPIDVAEQLLVEIDGGAYVAGRHTRGAGFERDCEKASAAAILGYRVIRATPRQVEDGSALSWIRQALGMEVAA